MVLICKHSFRIPIVGSYFAFPSLFLSHYSPKILVYTLICTIIYRVRSIAGSYIIETLIPLCKQTDTTTMEYQILLNQTLEDVCGLLKWDKSTIPKIITRSNFRELLAGMIYILIFFFHFIDHLLMTMTLFTVLTEMK